MFAKKRQTILKDYMSEIRILVPFLQLQSYIYNNNSDYDNTQENVFFSDCNES